MKRSGFNPMYDGLFLVCSRMMGGGRGVWWQKALLLLKIRYTYLKTMKLGAVILYVKEIQKICKPLEATLEFLLHRGKNIKLHFNT